MPLRAVIKTTELHLRVSAEQNKITANVYSICFSNTGKKKFVMDIGKEAAEGRAAPRHSALKCLQWIFEVQRHDEIIQQQF